MTRRLTAREGASQDLIFLSKFHIGDRITTLGGASS